MATLRIMNYVYCIMCNLGFVFVYCRPHLVVQQTIVRMVALYKRTLSSVPAGVFVLQTFREILIVVDQPLISANVKWVDVSWLMIVSTD